MPSGTDQTYAEASLVAEPAAINVPAPCVAEQAPENGNIPSNLEFSAPNGNADQPGQSAEENPPASEMAHAEEEVQGQADAAKPETNAEKGVDKPPSSQTSARNLLEAQRDVRVAEMSQRAVAAAEGEPKPIVARRLAQAMAFTMSQVNPKQALWRKTLLADCKLKIS